MIFLKRSVFKNFSAVVMVAAILFTTMFSLSVITAHKAGYPVYILAVQREVGAELAAERFEFCFGRAGTQNEPCRISRNDMESQKREEGDHEHGQDEDNDFLDKVTQKILLMGRCAAVCPPRAPARHITSRFLRLPKSPSRTEDTVQNL